MLEEKTVASLLKQQMQHLQQVYHVKRIGLFGSIVKRSWKEGSDIDIFVEFKRPIGFTFINFAEYMEKLLGQEVDIITREGLRGIRIKEIANDIEKSIHYV